MTNTIQLFIHDPLTTMGNKETVLLDFRGILKQMFQNYGNIVKRCLFGTTYSSTRAHNSVQPVC